MSGSRRNRILNLNTSLQSTTVSNHNHVPQPSAVTPYQRQQPPAVNNPNPNPMPGGVAPRPMVIQYATNPYYPTTYSVPAPAPVQTRPQFPSQGPDFSRTLPPPSPTMPRTSPNTDFAIDRLSQTLVAAMTPILGDQQKSLASEIKKVEGSLDKFVTDVRETRTETNKRLFQLTEAMQTSVHIQQGHTKATNKRIEKIEALIMACFDRNDEASLISRLENIQYAVGELSERIKDPGAPDFFVAPQPAQTANYIEARALPTPPQSIEERPPSPVQRIYDDKSTSCDIPEPLPERSPSPVRPIYKDAASDAVSLEPEVPPMTSSIRPEYKSVGNDPQTPSPPHRLQRASSLEHSGSSDPVNFIDHGKRASEATTFDLEYEIHDLFGECDDPINFIGHHKKASETSTFDELEGSRDSIEEHPVGIKNSNSNRRAVRKKQFFESDSEEEDPGDDSMVIDIDTSVDVAYQDELEGSRDSIEEHPVDIKESNLNWTLKKKKVVYRESVSEEEGPGDDSMVIDIDTSVDVDSHVESEPELDQMATDDEAYVDAQIDDGITSTPHLSSFLAHVQPIEHESDFSVPIPIEIRTSASPEEVHRVDGSVAALRQTVSSTSSEASQATPSQSQEQRSLPSPATTPSAPASPERELSPDTVPVETLPQRRPVYAISSPTSSSYPDREVSSPRPDDAEPASITALMPPTPVSAPLPKINVTPTSDDGSELSVSRIVTAQTSDQPEIPTFSSPVAPVPEHIEETQTQASPQPPPLFIPESRSQSPPRPNDVQFESFLESPPPSPKPHPRTPSKSQSVHPTTPVVQQTSSAKSPTTIFNTPLQKLRRWNSNQTIISIKSTPQKTPAITRKVIVQPSSSQPKTINPIMIHSSPMFVPSRSSSPLSPIVSGAESEGDSGSDSESYVVRVKKKEPKILKKSSSAKVENEPSTSTSGPVGRAGSGSATGPRHIDLLKKLQTKKGESAALTRVRKRKAPTAEQMEPPLKRARQKASVSAAAEVEREVSVKRETPSVGVPSASGHVSGRGKGKGKGRERDDENYKLPNNIKVKASPVKEKLRPRAPPPGVRWPQKNMSGDKNFDSHFIECDRCYTWYHYGCVGIMDSKDPIIKGDGAFICPPCTGGGANPMLPSDSVSCGRPDCEKEQKRDDEYFMTAIIGRSTKVSGGIGREYVWLVKWDGYSVKDCTWEGEDGMSDPQSFIQDFNRKATMEGKDPDEDPYSTILLNEAIRGGWTDPNA